MSIVILMIENVCALPGDPDIAGKYLRTYNPDGMAGFGTYTATSDVSEAMKFPDLVAAHACWKQQSRIRPLRDDGEPNRPLTAFTISFETVDD